MKLVLVITDYGSFNNFLSELARKIIEHKGIELHVICSKEKVIQLKDKHAFTEGSVTFHYVNIPRNITIIGEWKAAKAIKAIINSVRPQLVHVHFTTAAFPTVLLKKSAIPYWGTFHGLGMNASDGLKKVVFSLVEMVCFWRLNRIFTVNQQDSNLVNKYFSGKLKKYDCFGFGCDIEKFNSDNFSAADRNELKNTLGIKDEHFVLTFTGRYVHFKGFHLVIKAFIKLVANYPDTYKLILMGGADNIHPTGLNEIETQFLSTSKDIINIGFTSDVQMHLSVTDVFLFPSKKEGLPTCTMEALAMGIPVITFDTRGNNDIVINNHNGFLISAQLNDVQREITDIISAVEKLKSDKTVRPIMSSNALKDRYKYSRNRFVNEQIKYYNELRQK